MRICPYCEIRGCSGRCRRSDLLKVIHKLRKENERLSEGESLMERELDRLTWENRTLRSDNVVLAWKDG